jgi:hypothetical protein
LFGSFISAIGKIFNALEIFKDKIIEESLQALNTIVSISSLSNYKNPARFMV